MQKLAEICIRRPIFAAMIIMALVVVGTASYFRLQVDRNPKVDLPTVSIRTNLPGASPEEVETQVSQVMEEVVNTVEGITELRSFSQTGNSSPSWFASMRKFTARIGGCGSWRPVSGHATAPLIPLSETLKALPGGSVSACTSSLKA